MDQQVNISMEITRIGSELSSVSVIMPTWNRTGDDGKIYAKIPFLGIETYGKNEADLGVAIEEALTCFCLAAEKHGKGLECELAFLGWTQLTTTDTSHSFLKAITDNKAFGSALSTGDTRALTVNVPPSHLVPEFA
ncbi:hypothetical protein [Spirosoma spitsbergense]|uniref:hypothetical protein n=1 Tax=Spirosoma spitsbergense TaxID=431554 RepID=UPI00037FFCCF|nr:hypothetical protein [Spirosoma spitsbergense]